MEDPYSILGVSRSAAADEIKNAYRALAKKLHPDLNPGNQQAEKRFKEVSAAYEILGDPEKRAKFDRGEPEPAGAGSRPGAGPYYYQTQRDGGRYTDSFDEEIFGNLGDIFSRAHRPTGAGRHAGARPAEWAIPGEDRRFEMEVDFRDAILGVEREISLPDGKRLRVKIPPGIDSGQSLRFKGQGYPGIGDAPPGDAYVVIYVRPQSGFRRNGNDIETDLPVSLPEAVLGGEVRVPTVDGAVMLRIPPGSNTGTRLRIRGKGVRGTLHPGDQIVVLQVRLPEKPDSELQNAIRLWAQSHAYDPRAQEAA